MGWIRQELFSSKQLVVSPRIWWKLKVQKNPKNIQTKHYFQLVGIQEVFKTVILNEEAEFRHFRIQRRALWVVGIMGTMAGS